MVADFAMDRFAYGNAPESYVLPDGSFMYCNKGEVRQKLMEVYKGIVVDHEACKYIDEGGNWIGPQDYFGAI